MHVSYVRYRTERKLGARRGPVLRFRADAPFSTPRHQVLGLSLCFQNKLVLERGRI
jgi:hypothetical protein